MSEQYVIWSEEHGAWWASNELGYTRWLQLAGRYSPEKAKEICEQANRYWEAGELKEVCMPDPLAG